MAMDFTEIAPSTVGISVYNMVAMCAKPISPETIVARLRVQHFAELELADCAAPITFMLKKGWLKTTGDSRLDVVDPERRQITSRGRNDIVYDDGGILVGGWSGWIARCPNCSPKFLDDIVEEVMA